MDETPSPDTRLVAPGDPGAALMLLTRLPVPARWAAPARGARAAWAWPLAGLGVGALGGGVAALAGAVWPPAVAAGLALLAGALATGALHEDGLADCADGIWGARDRARRLEILRDSRVGSYGVLALVLATGLRWALVAALVAGGGALAGLVAAAMLSRAAMAGIAAALPFARPDGLARLTGRPGWRGVALGGALAGGAALVLAGGAGLGAALAAAAAAALVAGLALRSLGGQTGDVLGAGQVVAEIAALALLVALAQ